MMNYLFEIVMGEYEGVMFFVQENSQDAAFVAALEISEQSIVQYHGEYSDEEAEMMGYDTF